MAYSFTTKQYACRTLNTDKVLTFKINLQAAKYKITSFANAPILGWHYVNLWSIRTWNNAISDRGLFECTRIFQRHWGLQDGELALDYTLFSYGTYHSVSCFDVIPTTISMNWCYTPLPPGNAEVLHLSVKAALSSESSGVEKTRKHAAPAPLLGAHCVTKRIA